LQLTVNTLDMINVSVMQDDLRFSRQGVLQFPI
jgi:hypothetical protein